MTKILEKQLDEKERFLRRRVLLKASRHEHEDDRWDDQGLLGKCE